MRDKAGGGDARARLRGREKAHATSQRACTRARLRRKIISFIDADAHVQLDREMRPHPPRSFPPISLVVRAARARHTHSLAQLTAPTRSGNWRFPANAFRALVREPRVFV